MSTTSLPATGAGHPAEPPPHRTLHRTEVDGVPTFWVPGTGSATAALSFRGGFADERLTRRGWTHLLEHAAMHGREDPSFAANASVGPLVTEFLVQGDEDQVVGFLDGLTRWLAAPDLSDLDHERRILAAESAQRTTGDFAIHLTYRFGPHGLGSVVYDELGLRTATEEDLRALAARTFVQGNAALALSFEPTAGLRLTLPEGAHLPPPDLPRHRVPLPSHITSGTGDVAVSGYLGEGVTAPLLAELLGRAVNQRLRHDLGASYGTQHGLERIATDRLMLLLWADIGRDHAPDGVELVRDALQRVVADGFDPDEVDAVRTRRLREMVDAPDGAFVAFSAARAHLDRRRVWTEQEVAAHWCDLDAAALTHQARLFLDTALYSSPTGKESRTSLRWSDGFDRVDVAGAVTTFTPWRTTDRTRLHVSPRSCALTDDETTHAAVNVPTTAALLAYPDGARLLIGDDGATIGLDPRAWRHGERAVTILDEAVDPAVVVPMEPRDPDQVTKLPAPGRRAIAHVLAHPRMLVALAVVLVVVLTVVAGLNGYDVPLPVSLVVVAFFWAAAARATGR